jgi:hypothetical protein
MCCPHGRSTRVLVPRSPARLGRSRAGNLSRVRRRSVTRLGVFAAIICISGCFSSAQGAHDNLCREIAAFANASVDKVIHTVELTNDWGCDFQKPENGELHSLACKGCAHGGYIPAKKLCSYSMQNTSTEFPDTNFRSALACLNTQYYISPHSRSSVERLSNRAIWSNHAQGTHVGISVGVEYSLDVKESPEILTIFAQRRAL